MKKAVKVSDIPKSIIRVLKSSLVEETKEAIASCFYPILCDFFFRKDHISSPLASNLRSSVSEERDLYAASSEQSSLRLSPSFQILHQAIRIIKTCFVTAKSLGGESLKRV